MCFSALTVEMEHEREVSRCQLQKQSEDILSAMGVLSQLTYEMTSLHHLLSKQSEWWLQKLNELEVNDGNNAFHVLTQETSQMHENKRVENIAYTPAPGATSLSGL